MGSVFCELGVMASLSRCQHLCGQLMARVRTLGLPLHCPALLPRAMHACVGSWGVQGDSQQGRSLARDVV